VLGYHKADSGGGSWLSRQWPSTFKHEDRRDDDDGDDDFDDKPSSRQLFAAAAYSNACV